VSGAGPYDLRVDSSVCVFLYIGTLCRHPEGFFLFAVLNHRCPFILVNASEPSPSESRPSPSIDPSLETRAAIDVLFEALAHIQASQETSSEEARAEAYRNFKEALYTRFEYLKKERYAAAAEGRSPEEAREDQASSSLDGPAAPEGEEERQPDAGKSDETLQKFWPAISGD
jgi:hypothetical protein